VADYYYVPHYTVPYTGFNLVALDFDIRTSPPRRIAFENALTTQKPALTDRLVLLGDVAEIDGYSVILMHPGIPSQSRPPNEASFVVVRMRSLLLRSVAAQTRKASVFVYDVTNTNEEASFLGALAIKTSNTQETEFLAEVDLATARNKGDLVWQDTLSIADRQWVIVVTQDEHPEIVFIVIASSIIFLTCICLALWYFTNARREARMNALRAASETEKAALILEHAENAAKHERDLVSLQLEQCRSIAAFSLTFGIVQYFSNRICFVNFPAMA
jgi:CHASE1-domain containing sensor protein